MIGGATSVAPPVVVRAAHGGWSAPARIDANTGAAAALGCSASPRSPQEQIDASRSRWLDVLVRHPEVIQRPIITTDDGATIARTPAAVQASIEAEAAAADGRTPG